MATSSLKVNLADRLRQYAERIDRIMEALKRVEGMPDDYNPSAYTPCRIDSRKQLEDLLGTVAGYCYAVDDILGRIHGTTYKRFSEARGKGLHNEADGRRFLQALFEEEEED